MMLINCYPMNCYLFLALLHNFCLHDAICRLVVHIFPMGIKLLFVR